MNKSFEEYELEAKRVRKIITDCLELNNIEAAMGLSVMLSLISGFIYEMPSEIAEVISQKVTHTMKTLLELKKEEGR